MIINSLRAHNVLKYARLEMKALPAKGMIAISGLNESGKSSIGETICFALFGQTFSLDPEHITKVIRWGETQCATLIEFTPSNGKRYRLERFLDRYGNQGARLSLVGRRQPIARSVTDVDSKLNKLIQFDYPQFVESFYLIQRELKTPHPHSVAVKTMAGVAALEDVGKVLTAEIAEHKGVIKVLDQQITQIREQISHLGVQAERLVELEDRCCLVREGKSERMKLAERLKLALQACKDSISWIRGSIVELNASLQRRSALQRAIPLFLSLAGTAWGTALLAQVPRVEGSPGWLQWDFLTLESGQDLWLFSSAGILSLLLIGLWVRRRLLEWRLAAFEQSLIEQARTLEILKQDFVEDKEVDLADFGEPLLEAKYLNLCSQTLELAQTYAARVTALQDQMAAQETQINYTIKTLTQELERLEEAIAEEQERRRQAQVLADRIEKTQAQIEDYQQKIKVREYALELLTAACRHLSRRFNTYIGIVAKTLLPSLTGGRYEHLRIDEDLNVQIFSSEKSDFMDIDEISSGTQRQIMLCIRLALSQALIKTAVRGPQFVFLDEPFAFSDQQRVRGAIAALRRLHELFSQVFIIAQEFPEDVTVDKHIVCKREMKALIFQRA